MNRKASSTDFRHYVRLATLLALCIGFLSGLNASAHAVAYPKRSVHSLPTRRQLAEDTLKRAAQGMHLSPEAAAKLERSLQTHPDDLKARAELFGYYFEKVWSSVSARQACQKQAFWFIAHHPESEFAGWIAGLGSFMLYDSEVAALWQHQTQQHPNDARVLGNAAEFFQFSRADVVDALLKKAQILEPQNPKWPEQLGRNNEHLILRAAEEDRLQVAHEALANFERALALTRDVRDKEDILTELTKTAYAAEEFEKAITYATHLLKLATHLDRRDRGDAIHQGNLALGRVALHSGDVAAAKAYLLAAGRAPGTAVLNSFGPRMILAQELFAKGERQTVLDYFDLCARFWKDKRLNVWREQVAQGEMPHDTLWDLQTH